MAQREMSGKALLDKLYGGLDTMPAVEAEMDASDLRRLTDDLLGKPPNGVESPLTITGVNSVAIPGQHSDFRDSESLEFAISVQITNIRRRDVDAERNIGTTVLDPQFREAIDSAG